MLWRRCAFEVKAGEGRRLKEFSNIQKRTSSSLQERQPKNKAKATKKQPGRTMWKPRPESNTDLKSKLFTLSPNVTRQKCRKTAVGRWAKRIQTQGYNCCRWELCCKLFRGENTFKINHLVLNQGLWKCLKTTWKHPKGAEYLVEFELMSHGRRIQIKFRLITEYFNGSKALRQCNDTLITSHLWL